MGGTPAPQDVADAHAGQPGSSGRQRKPAAGKRGRAAAAEEDEEGASGAESAGRGTADAEEQQLAPPTKKAGSGGSGKRAVAARSRPAGMPSRQQPRRGSKTDAVGKLRDEPSEVESETAGSSQEAEAGEEAPRAQRLQQRQQPVQKQEQRGRPAVVPQGRNLRADTDDEEWEDDEEAQRQEPSKPAAAPAAVKQPAKQRAKQPRKQQGYEQENRVLSNAAPAAKRGGSSKPATAGKGTASAVKPLLKRTRA